MNLDNMIEGEKLKQFLPDVKKVFFYRICGTGMGAVACLLKQRGYLVEGADQSFSPPMSTYLESLEIPLYQLNQVDEYFLNNYDLIIVGNSVPRMSDHARQIERSGVPFTSFPSFLGASVLSDREVVGIAGTHGKTTTTYFLMQMLKSLGENPGYLIGGILDNAPPSEIGESKYFVIESDEYDCAYFQKYSKFRLYEVNHMLLTSLEFDHADIYNKVEEIEEQFENVLPSLSSINADASYDSIQKLYKKFPKLKWSFYHQDPQGPKNIEDINGKTVFVFDGESFETNVIGRHNIYNICACIAFLKNEGFDLKKIKDSVQKLELVKRRQEYRGLYKGMVVIDDFAHHPRAIELTIESIRAKYPGSRILTIFEPISATARSNIFQKEFTQSLAKSDEVILAPASIKTTVVGKDQLDCQKIVDDLAQSDVYAQISEDTQDLIHKIDQRLEDGKVVLVLSNRTCQGLWESQFVQDLN